MTDRNMSSSSHRTFRAVAVLLLCLLAPGCGQLARSLVDLSRLQAAIIKEYGDKNVNVNLNNSTVLTVTFINSPLNAYGREERAKRASQTAEFINRHYPSIAEMEEIWVSFVRAETRFIVVNYTESLDVFAFDKTGRPLTLAPKGPPASVPDDSLRPIAVYSPNLKQTEVMITSLQLAGDLNQGMALAPHFTVPGDATGVRRSASSPQSVSFDFASYSEKSLFPGETRIRVLADGKAVFETSGVFSTSRQADGLFSEFLWLKIPYPAFRRMTTGKKLTLKLGDNEYRLTDEQVEALRGMTQYVGE